MPVTNRGEAGAGAPGAGSAGRTSGAQARGAETARRTLRMLEALVAHEPVRLEELAAETGLNKSTTYRLLRVLQEERYAERQASGGYRLGPAFFGLAEAALPGDHFYASAAPIIHDLADATGETVTLHRRAGDLSILVYGAESDHVVRQVARVGEACPLTRGCSALTILADLPAVTIDAVLTRSPLPAAARARLRTRLAAIHEAGYAISHAENHPGVTGVSMPLRFPEGARDLEMSVTISGPESRWTTKKAESIRPRLTTASAALAHYFTAATT